MGAGGWIKKHRSADEHPLLQKFDAAGVWDKLLLRARKWPARERVNGRIVELGPGQLAVSLSAFADEGGVSRKRMRTIIGSFVDDGMLKVGQAKGHACSIITICNFDEYQGPDADEGKPNGQGRANQGPSSGQGRAKVGPTIEERESEEGKTLEPSIPTAVVSDPRAAKDDDEEAAPPAETCFLERCAVQGMNPASTKREVASWKAALSPGKFDTILTASLRAAEPYRYASRSVGRAITELEAAIAAARSPPPEAPDPWLEQIRRNRQRDEHHDDDPPAHRSLPH